MAGKIDLKPAFKTHLAAILYASSRVTFDATRDLLIDTGPPIMRVGITPGRWINPDPTIAKAEAEYKAALAAARRPEPTRSPTPGQENAGRLPPRPGFAC
jgi:hypothetical protein